MKNEVDTSNMTEKERARAMHAEFKKYFEHVLSHDPEDARFCVLIAGHQDETAPDNPGARHVCQMIGGAESEVVNAIADILFDMIEERPEVIPLFLSRVREKLQGLIRDNAEVILDDEGNRIGLGLKFGKEELPAESMDSVDELLKNFLNNPPTSETKH